MGAERWLAQEGGHKLVPVDLMNTAAHGASPSIQTLSLFELAGLLVAARACIFHIENNHGFVNFFITSLEREQIEKCNVKIRHEVILGGLQSEFMKYNITILLTLFEIDHQMDPPLRLQINLVRKLSIKL